MTILEQMCDYGHERVAFHHDKATGLKAMIALHSTALGNALGGTRRWHYATEQEALRDVLRLSQGMTYKCACAGLPTGGGKSVIMLPEPGHRATEAEARAMGRFVDTFSGAYIAAEDVGTTTQYIDWMAQETRHVMGGEKISTGGDPSPYTARGVVNGMRASLQHVFGTTSFEGRTVAIQGLGNVGRYMAAILTKLGAIILGADINRASVDRCVAEFGITPVSPDQVLRSKCDILAPCALGGVLGASSAGRLNCRIICGGANNVLEHPVEDAALLKRRGITYAPDFVVNAGGVIHLSGTHLGMTQKQLDKMIADIEQTTATILEEGRAAPSTFAAAVALAERRIAEGARSPQEQVHAG